MFLIDPYRFGEIVTLDLGVNWDAELGDMTHWTSTVGTMQVRTSADREPPQGGSIFDGGTALLSKAYRRINLSTLTGLDIADVDAGLLDLFVQWWGGTYIQGPPADAPQINVYFRNAALASIYIHASGYKVPTTQVGLMYWDEYLEIAPIPPNTRYIDIEMDADRNTGTNNDAAFDDIRVSFHEPDNIELFTVNGSYTKPVGLGAWSIIAIGSGGGGGAGSTETSAGTADAASGGAGGGVAFKGGLQGLITATTTVKVGIATAGGAAHSSVTSTGGAGGVGGGATRLSQFGTFTPYAAGGTGGQGGVPGGQSPPKAGGTGTIMGGDSGQGGSYSGGTQRAAGDGESSVYGGTGGGGGGQASGSSASVPGAAEPAGTGGTTVGPYAGAGGAGGAAGVVAINGNPGEDGALYGGGGGGSSGAGGFLADAAAVKNVAKGGDGAPGILVVREYNWSGHWAGPPVVSPGAVSALLHLNGTDASTTFTDETGLVWSGSGNAQLDTAQRKYGVSSAYLDGGGDRLLSAASANLALTTTYWTMELYFRVNAYPGAVPHVWQIGGPTSAQRLLLYVPSASANLTLLSITAGNPNVSLDLGFRPTIGQWYHAATVRNNTQVRQFIDGVALGTMTSPTLPNSTTPTLSVGWQQFSGGGFDFLEWLG